MKEIITKSFILYPLYLAFSLATLLWIWLSILLHYQNPFIWLYNCIVKSETRIYILFYWGFCLLFGIKLIENLSLPNFQIKRINLRKLFHILAIMLFLPPLLLKEFDYMFLSYGIAFALLLVVEFTRVNYENVPFYGKPIHEWYKSFIDEKDLGSVIITHFYLLLGCAVPLAVFSSLVRSQEEIEKTTSLYILPYLGIVTLGLGDTSAAYIGSTFGVYRWFSMKTNRRTIEGSSAMYLVLFIVFFSLETKTKIQTFMFCLVISAFITLFEAFTGQIDNLVLPIFSCTVFLLFKSLLLSLH